MSGFCRFNHIYINSNVVMYNLPSDSVITLTELEGTLTVLNTASTVMSYLTNSSNPLIVALFVDLLTDTLPSSAKLSTPSYDMT